MKRILFFAACSLMFMNSRAQSTEEKQAVKSLCGCFEVEFKYAETFASDTAYRFHPRYHASGLEWVVAEESSGEKWVLQHLLVIDDTTVIKHWREDWEFEKQDLWSFNYDATWTHSTFEKQQTKGLWTQTVWEVDDGPRYQGSGRWVHSNGKYYWENTTDAPLPRREYTKRNDYNVMKRTNRIIITDTGWVHEQDNEKIIRRDSLPDVSIVGEKGYNIYRRTDESKCKQASAWWQQHKQFWSAIRQGWETVMKDKNSIHLLAEVDGEYLYQRLDELEKQGLAIGQLKEKVLNVLDKYTKSSSGKSSVAVKDSLKK